MSARSKMRVIGIDVSKASLDVAMRKKNGIVVKTMANTHAGIKQLQRFIGKKHALIVVEATGIYSALVHEVLTEAGLPVAIVNPKRVRDLVRGLGREAKTDALDAAGILLFGEVTDVKPTPLPPLIQRELRALVACRKQIQQQLLRCRNQRESMSSSLADDVFSEIEMACRNKMDEVEKRIQELLKDPSFRETADLLQQQKGIGPISAAVLIAELPELGHLNNKQIAALVGLAPFANDSGTMRKRRFTKGGRAAPRSALYMSALVASRHDDVLAAFYARLVANGKTKKQAIIAVARKLLVWLNARTRDLIHAKNLASAAETI